jgi:hypothetical protein
VLCFISSDSNVFTSLGCAFLFVVVTVVVIISSFGSVLTTDSCNIDFNLFNEFVLTTPSITYSLSFCYDDGSVS